ncbi:MAG: NRDE family protein, partial [Rubrivivax sp.]
MCLAAFALNAHPRFPLVIAANRDEFFARAAAPMAWWVDRPDVLAGRDLSAGGTWFGLTRAGRLALLTNVREPGRQIAEAPSRGALVVDWLGSDESAPAFAHRLADGYNGFNLITADLARHDWHWLSNRTATPFALGTGIHALSNAALDAPWPKTVGLRSAMGDALAVAADADDLIER